VNLLKTLKGRRWGAGVTILVFLIMFFGASLLYPSFLSLQVFLNLFIDNAFLGIIAIGMTMVIISGSGGIDLSVGSVMGLTTMIVSALLAAGWDPFLVITVALLAGATLGLGMGCLIQFFKVPPFIATLAGYFFARGMCYIVSLDQIPVTNDTFVGMSGFQLALPWDTHVTLSVIIYAVVIAAGIFLTRYSRFGRVLYAMGGNEQSATLMGLPVARTRVIVYTISGFCSALGGIVFTLYMLSGYALHGQGLEMDAIASAVIGGTLLSGGIGSVTGTVFGTLILGTIQTIISFDGTLSSWWTKIIVGLLIFFSILFQWFFGLLKKGRKKGIA
jgi:galactofuranose transport system permease protein